jgi:hypothetical protein
MKPHKHAELIKAWADGAEIEERYIDTENQHLYDWVDFDGNWAYTDTYEYRIKPELKPDNNEYYYAYKNGRIAFVSPADNKINLKLTFDGETGELKSAEVLK